MIKVSPRAKKVSFEVALPEAENVVLVGDFNNWDSNATPMKKNRKGIWKTEMPLGEGNYQFRYLVNSSEWLNDHEVETVPNTFGSVNNVAQVSYPKPKTAAKKTTRKRTKKS